MFHDHRQADLIKTQLHCGQEVKRVYIIVYCLKIIDVNEMEKLR